MAYDPRLDLQEAVPARLITAAGECPSSGTAMFTYRQWYDLQAASKHGNIAVPEDGHSPGADCANGKMHAPRLSSFLRLKPTREPAHSPCVEGLKIEDIQRAVQLALAEDVGSGDVTTLATVPESATAVATMRTREPIVVAGLPLAEATFLELSKKLVIEHDVQEGQRVEANQTLMTIKGPARALLTGERVALNFVQRLSGIATLTAQFVEAVKGTNAHILDTRKTTPGLRALEKYAVACGGGQNHRMGLFDMVLIKDNHLAALNGEKNGAIATAIKRARAKYPNLKIEIEADTLEQVELALAADADLILLDNMTPPQLRSAADKCRGRAKTEASGGVNLSTVRAIAESGVDYISVGALTHSARAVDIGLDFEL